MPYEYQKYKKVIRIWFCVITAVKKIQTKLFVVLMNLSIILNLMRQISDVKPIKDTIAND